MERTSAPGTSGFEHYYDWILVEPASGGESYDVIGWIDGSEYGPVINDKLGSLRQGDGMDWVMQFLPEGSPARYSRTEWARLIPDGDNWSRQARLPIPGGWVMLRRVNMTDILELWTRLEEH